MNNLSFPKTQHGNMDNSDVMNLSRLKNVSPTASTSANLLVGEP
jgi:hypothetical protein